MEELPGRHCPPMFGDFEAQRHWMEICIHLPVREWSDKIDRSWVALHVSRGIETDAHKLLMRLSVMVSVWALYIPALITFAFLSSGNVNDKVANLWCALNVIVKLKNYEITELIWLRRKCKGECYYCI
ncbi:putative dolichyl pyrophosphate Man9GlcNAc2 alpha-1,3-glucosyltransferase [Toxocara canis]|uniref:Alpha-1,3-glucosyltransferase n=1 Tax=Toxocara canis TaxID=6265 RepID=A0A0B2VP12_TOXCA|nr:putative dolichyl pyrophosphate Man9GlcNAc2 alpha-1,3-glucosyltransferase [Toxocara canis]